MLSRIVPWHISVSCWTRAMLRGKDSRVSVRTSRPSRWMVNVHCALNEGRIRRVGVGEADGPQADLPDGPAHRHGVQGIDYRRLGVQEFDDALRAGGGRGDHHPELAELLQRAVDVR